MIIMDLSKKVAVLLSGLGLIAGTLGTVALQTRAANNESSSSAGSAAAATTPGPAGARRQGHAPLGGDGNITAINGTTVTMQEEADEGGAFYTVDAANATVTSNGAASSLSILKVGDKIFVQGATSGTQVAATSISLGHAGGFGHFGHKFQGSPKTQ